MYILDHKKIKGEIKIRNIYEEPKDINRQNLVAFLEKEKEKEKDLTQKQDYEILIASIMGIESLVIEDKKIQVVYTEELRWRGESEGQIVENDRMIQNIKEYLKTAKTKRIKMIGTRF